MTYNQDNNNGCFTKDDFIYMLLMLANQHWTIDQAEPALYILVEEGELQDRIWEIRAQSTIRTTRMTITKRDIYLEEQLMTDM